jgi:uncharacterized ferritin-like protein (DUF455 family)
MFEPEKFLPQGMDDCPSNGLFAQAAAALASQDPQIKVHAARAIAAQALQHAPLGTPRPPATLTAGRPVKPELVHPSQLTPRKLGSAAGRAAMIHAIAHIEFNAINLALDAVCRFPHMPDAYHRDWLRIAAEEAHHFALLDRHLQTLGYRYGDFPAHSGLWDMAERTANDVLLRMALVPRVLEARGLDVTPGIQARLLAAGDREAAAILDIIFRDEVGHVAAGSRWFRWLCRERGLAPLETFRHCLARIDRPLPPTALNRPARLQAGFTKEELAVLEPGAASR